MPPFVDVGYAAAFDMGPLVFPVGYMADNHRPTVFDLDWIHDFGPGAERVQSHWSASQSTSHVVDRRLAIVQFRYLANTIGPGVFCDHLFFLSNKKN
jgi:hypothetical protein